MDTIYIIIIGFAVALALLLAFINGASARFRSTYNKYDGVRNHLGISAEQFLITMREFANMPKLNFARIKGKLSDCYIPKQRTIALSESTYQNDSVAAVAVVAHEFGHAMQHHKRSFMYTFYHFCGRVFSFFAKLIVPALIVGIILVLFVENYVDTGWIVIYSAIGVLLCGIFYKILTVPVEWDASTRALKILKEHEVLTDKELKMAKKVLSTAAATYVADFLSTMLGISFIKRHGIRRK